MYKLVVLLKRRPGMSVQEFRDYYETRHRVIGEKHLGGVTRYVRRYLDPLPNMITGDIVEPDHDVLTEMWFSTKEDFERMAERNAAPEVLAEIVADEENLFDRSAHRYFLVTECESAIAG